MDDTSPYLDTIPAVDRPARDSSPDLVPQVGWYASASRSFDKQARGSVRLPNRSKDPGQAAGANDDASPWFKPRSDPKPAVTMEEQDYIPFGAESDNDVTSPAANGRLGPRHGRVAGIKREHETDSESDDEGLGKVRFEKRLGLDSHYNAADREHPGYISALTKKRIKVKYEEDGDQSTLNNLSLSRSRATDTQQPKLAKAEKEAQSEAARETTSMRQEINLKMSVADLEKVITLRHEQKDLDFGPFAIAPVKPKKVLLARLRMKDERLARERKEQEFDKARDVHAMPPRVAAQAAYQKMLYTAFQKGELLKDSLEVAATAMIEGDHLPVGNLGNVSFSLWSKDYVSFVQTAIKVVLRIRELPDYGMKIPGVRSYSADLVFSPTFGVVDRVVGIPQMSLPTADACVPNETIKVRAFKLDPRATTTLQWMKSSASRHDSPKGPLQYFDIDINFLGHGRLMLRIPSHVCYGTSMYPTEASHWWPTDFEFFAEPGLD